jgi:hypothetical protein
MTVSSQREYTLAAAIILTAISISVCSYRLLHQLSGPAGFDGYYYVLQVESIVKSGVTRLHTATPAVFYIQAVVALIVGNVIAGIKLSVIVATLVLFLLVYRVGHEDTADPWASLVGSSVIVLATPFEYIQVEFVKTLFGLIFVLSAFLTLKAHLKTRRIGSLISGIGFLAIGALSHKAAAIIGLALLIQFICHRTERLERLSRRGWRGRQHFATISLMLIPVVFLSGWLISIKNHEHVLRFNSHLSSTDVSLVCLPMVIGSCALQYLMWNRDAGPTLFEPSLSFSRGFILAISALAAFVVPLRFINLGPMPNQILDRACLAFLPFLAIHIGLCVTQIIRGTRRLSSCLCLLFVLALFSPAVPPGIGYWKSFPMLTAPSLTAQSRMSPNDVVIAPHGVEFLLMSKFGFHSTHFARTTARGGRLYLFVSKETSIVNQPSSACAIDLGGACLLEEIDYDVARQGNEFFQ